MLTTEDLAAALGLKAATLRHRLCVEGTYFGITPHKLPNGRLLWPSDSIERLTTGAKGQDNAAAGGA